MYGEEYSDKVKFRDTTDRRQPASVVQGEPINIEGEFNSPAPAAQPAVSAISQLVEGAARERNEADDNQERAETGRPQRKPSGGIGGELAILLGGLAGSAISGGRSQGFQTVVDKRLSAHQARQDKLNAHLAKSKGTATKHQKFKYKDDEGKTRWGSYNPTTKEYETDSKDLTAVGGFDEWTTKQDRRDALVDTKFGRKTSGDFTKAVADTEGVLKQLEESYSMLGTGTLQNEVAIRKILTSVEKRLTDEDYQGFVAEPSLVQAIKVKLTEWKTNEKNPRILKEAEGLLRDLIDSNRQYMAYKKEDLVRQMKEEGFEDYDRKLAKPYSSSVDTSKRKSVTRQDKLDEGATVDEIKAQIKELKKQLGQ